MKKVIYNSKLAHAILWANYTTITLTAFVFTEFNNKTEMPQSVRNHECTHARVDRNVFCRMGNNVYIAIDI